MSDTVTVKELMAFLSAQPEEAEIGLAGVANSPLIGFTPAAPKDDTLVVLMAFGSPPIPEPPVKFLFGFFEEGDYAYVGIVAQPFWEANGHLDDSSSAHSALPYVTAEDEEDDAEDRVYSWLDQATNGILAGEAMESCWEMLLSKEETKAKLEANGLVFQDMSKWDQ